MPEKNQPETHEYHASMSTPEWSMKEAEDAYKGKKAKEGPEEGWSLGNKEFGDDNEFRNATKTIQNFNPSNISGPIKDALKLLETLKKSKGIPYMENSVGAGNLIGMFQQLASLLKQQQKTHQAAHPNTANTTANNAYTQGMTSSQAELNTINQQLQSLGVQVN